MAKAKAKAKAKKVEFTHCARGHDIDAANKRKDGSCKSCFDRFDKSCFAVK